MTRKEREDQVRMRNMRGYFHLMHNHYPEDVGASIQCKICQEDYQRKLAAIGNTRKEAI
jgi:hypothetical protein